MNTVQLHRPNMPEEIFSLCSCIGPSHALLIKTQNAYLNITKLGVEVFDIHGKGCILTNCLTSIGPSMVIIVHQPPYVMLPVKLHEPWYDDPGLQVIDIINKALGRSKHFVGELILGISALIGILASASTSAVALVQEVKKIELMY